MVRSKMLTEPPKKTKIPGHSQEKPGIHYYLFVSIHSYLPHSEQYTLRLNQFSSITNFGPHRGQSSGSK